MLNRKAHGVGQPSSHTPNLSLWLPVGIWMGIIFGLSSQPHLPSVPLLGVIDWGDKIEHVITYGVGGWLIWRALGARMFGWRRVVIAILIAAAYGLSDEIHQRFVPPRAFDMLDWTADALGSAIGAVILNLTMGGREIGGRTRGREDLRSERQETL